MAQTLKDVHADRHDVDLAEIAAAFRVVQRSDEGQQLIKEIVPQAVPVGDCAVAKRAEGPKG